MIIHGFVFNEDTKPAHEHHLQTTPTPLQASFLSIMTMTVTYNLLHLTRTVGVKSLSRYLQYLTLIDSVSPINLKHQTISAMVVRRKNQPHATGQIPRHTLLFRPQKLCAPIRGHCPPAGIRQVTLSPSTAVPLYLMLRTCQKSPNINHLRYETRIYVYQLSQCI